MKRNGLDALIASEDLYACDYTTKTVKVEKQEDFEDREIKALSSQMRKSVIEEVQDNIKALSVSKKRGERTERLKFLFGYTEKKKREQT
ncbi:MAG: hypothetical protein LBO67_08225 [Spirochaetaceae bacterium]|nr:hypothetical protein [Spirochaetaceae bacterium]